MKQMHYDPRVIAELKRMPNVGPATARDLYRLGVRSRDDLQMREADAMYEQLCLLDGVRHDPCVWDVFAAVVDYAKGKGSKPWWHYSRIRKANSGKR